MFEKSKLHLRGCFRIELISGEFLPIAAAKQQAILAMLATATGGVRSRAWLLANLWGDSPSTDPSQNLRQALSQLRKVLIESGIQISADRRQVRLHLDTVDIIDSGDQAFLEGIDRCGETFEDWLRIERVARHQSDQCVPAAPAPAPSQRRVLITPMSAADQAGRWFEDLLADVVARSLRELFSPEVLVGRAPDDRPSDMRVTVRSFGSTEALGIRATFETGRQRQQVWAGHRQIQARGAPPVDHPDVLRLVNELVQAIGDHYLGRAQWLGSAEDPDHLCRRAIRAMFEIRKDSVDVADALLARAFDLEPRGLYLAWRAQIRAIRRVEKHATDPADLVGEGQAFAAQALELEPNNSMVLATVANTMGHLIGNREKSLILARRSVLLNPANPMAWWSLSSANVYGGSADASYRSAVHARSLALLSPHRFWWDNQLFGSAVVLGRLDEATCLAELAHSQNDAFRPPLRYLVALYANAGREEEAVAAAAKLREIEPDFSYERLVRDEEYPASLLQRAPGLDLDRISSLA